MKRLVNLARFLSKSFRVAILTIVATARGAPLRFEFAIGTRRSVYSILDRLQAQPVGEAIMVLVAAR